MNLKEIDKVVRTKRCINVTDEYDTFMHPCGKCESCKYNKAIKYLKEIAKRYERFTSLIQTHCVSYLIESKLNKEKGEHVKNDSVN